MQLIPIPSHDPKSAIPIPHTTVAAELATIHNIFIRALNSIYLQADQIPFSEHANFTTYCLIIHRCIIAYDAPSQSASLTELARQTGETRCISGHKEFDGPLRALGKVA
jgi:hypothetical protein